MLERVLIMNLKIPNTAAVILAAGSGSRMNMESTKQTLNICGKTILRRTLETFENSHFIASMVVVVRADEIEFAKREIKGLNKVHSVICGGKCRAESAKNGFEAVHKNTEFVMVHDAARCMITTDEIEKIATAAYRFGAATASLQVTDTLKLCDEDGGIISTVDRHRLRSVQTPQAFSYGIYSEALAAIGALDESITDDNMLVERMGITVHCVDCLSTNIKITTASDIALAEFIISKREEESNE